MAITITVEDGTGIEGANSWGSVSGARAFALNRGIVLSANNDTVARQLISAMDYLEQYRTKWSGTPVYEYPALPFPRQSMWVYGAWLDEDVIPSALIAAQYHLVIAQHNGIELQPNGTTDPFIIREKIDVIETEYATPLAGGALGPSFPIVDALLEPLLLPSVGRLRAVRI